MKKKQQRILTGLAGATMILSSAAAQADEAVFQSNAPRIPRRRARRFPIAAWRTCRAGSGSIRTA